MLDPYMQQWTAIQTIWAADLSIDDVVDSYFDVTGHRDELALKGYLTGLVMLPVTERDHVAQLVNELLDSTGSMVDGAHYSDHHVAASSGYSDYLRSLILTPDGYDFTAPPAGTHSAHVTEMNPVHEGGPVHLVRRADGDNEEADGLNKANEAGGRDDREFHRVRALHESGLLEAGQREAGKARLDRYTGYAREHFGVSSSSIALITEDMQIITSVAGPLGQDLPRHLSLCSVTIEQDRTLVIPDARVNPRWRDHPLVASGPEVRFYAGHPVTTIDGWRIGTICLMDDQPRTFTADDADTLRLLARRISRDLWS